MTLLLIASALAAPALTPAANADPTHMVVNASRTAFTEDTRPGPTSVARVDVGWIYSPLVWIGDDGDVQRIVEHVVPLTMAASTRFGALRIDVRAPAYLFSTGTGRGTAGGVLGDPSVGLKYGAYTTTRGGIALLGRLVGDLGANDYQLGDGGLSWELGIAADRQVGPLLLAANLGTRGVPANDLGQISVNDQLWYRLAAGLQIGESALAAELMGQTQYNEFFTERGASPLEAALTTSTPLSEQLRLRGGVGAGIVGGVGAPGARVFVGLRWAAE